MRYILQSSPNQFSLDICFSSHGTSHSFKERPQTANKFKYTTNHNTRQKETGVVSPLCESTSVYSGVSTYLLIVLHNLFGIQCSRSKEGERGHTLGPISDVPVIKLFFISPTTSFPGAHHSAG